MKLNIGCGVDYRERFINIDGSSEVKTDKLIDISNESLTDHFEENSVEYIMSSDIIEHHFHWEAIQILKDFYCILQRGGILDIRVPNCDYIINAHLPTETKLTLLFGGQDIPQGVDPTMDESRKKYPQYFCHKYGWTEDRLKHDLTLIGYNRLEFKNKNTNVLCRGIK